eukprot:6205426-Lingulodinium_polyedra.AAC.1
MKLAKQWDVLRSTSLMGRHRRQEITVDDSEPSLPASAPVTAQLFTAKYHALSVEGAHLTERRDWPSCS